MPGDIHLLKAVLTNQIYAGVACDCDERDGVGLRRCERGHKVRRAGAGGRKDHARFSAHARIAVRCVRCSLLMCAANRADTVAAAVQLVVNR